jgi:hypothetical protein
MKAIEWDGANGRNRQVLTGRILTSPTLPGDLADGDLWIDTSGVPLLKGKVAGTVYDIIAEGADEWPLWGDTFADELISLTYDTTITDVVATAYDPTTDFADSAPTVAIGFSADSISGLAFWYDASDSSSITHTSNAVTQWRDKSVNARHLNDVGVAAERPTTNVTSRNGRNVITFDGGDWLTHDAGSDVIDITPGTIFIVGMDDNSSQSSTTYRKFLSARRSSTATSDYQAPNFQVPKNNTVRQMYFTPNGNNSSAVEYPNSVYFITTLQYSASGTYVQFNATTPETNALNGDVALMRYLRVGSRCGTGTPPNVSSFPNESWVGPIAEIIAYNATLSSAEISTVQTYLAAKWDISLDSPFSLPWSDAYWADDPTWVNPGNGNLVTSWRDGGSAARDVTPSTGGSLITFSSSVSALNNRGGIVFAGSGDAVLETTAFSISEPYSLVAICVRNGTAFHGQEENIISLGDNDQGIYSRSIDGIWSLRAGGTPLLTGPAYTTGAGAAIRGHYTTSATTLSVNGTSVSGPGNTETWTSGLGIGGSPNPNGWFPSNATIAFVGYYPGDVTADPKWSAFVSWVSSYYGLTIS